MMQSNDRGGTICQLMIVRVEDGSRRRGSLLDRAGPRAHILEDRDGVVILGALDRPRELEQLLARLGGFEISDVVRSETLAMSLHHPAEFEVVS